MKLTVAGVGAGLLASVAVGRALSSLLYGIAPIDPLTYASVALAMVAFVAAYLPARRAASVDPVLTLKSE